jgi:dihydrolipoamide dehydrogenase
MSDKARSDNSISTDVAIIGSGPGGYAAAFRLAQLGKKVVLIEKEKIGGVCLNVGCIPSKALISASKLVKDARNASKMGINAQVSIDIEKLQLWKQSVVDRLTNGVALLCKSYKIEVVYGTARFVSPNELEVETNEGGRTRVLPHDIIIATGSSSIELPFAKFDGKRIISSTEALSIRQIPSKMLLIGGGVIGLEIGMAYANLFGTELIIVEMMDQLLPGTDLELVNLVSRNLDKLGAKIYLKSKFKQSSISSNKVRTVFESSDGTEQSAEVDYVLVGVGRRPNSEDLGLQHAGVAVDSKGFIKVDRQMKTNVSNIYAIGDVSGGPLLAHKATKEGVVAAEVISGLNSSADFQAMPSAIFSDPEISSVGMTPSDARSQGIEIAVGKFPFSANGRALASTEFEGFAKIIAEKNSGVILGVGIVGPESSNLINEASLAIEMGATLEDIGLTVHVHPTLPEVLMEAAENALGKAIHIQNRPRTQ